MVAVTIEDAMVVVMIMRESDGRVICLPPADLIGR